MPILNEVKELKYAISHRLVTVVITVFIVINNITSIKICIKYIQFRIDSNPIIRL